MNGVELEMVALALLDELQSDEGVTAKQIATNAGIPVDEAVFLLRGSEKVYLSLDDGPGADGLARYRRF